MDLADSNYIKNLIQLMGDSDLTEISLEHEQVKLTLKREKNPAPAPVTQISQPVQPAYQQPVETVVAAPPTAAPVSKTEPPTERNLHIITAPLVGTYYTAAAPDAPAYIHKGDPVKKGQTLCIVEAMKLMNEIESDVDGIVEAIYCDNATPVEYGTKLVAIRTE